MIVRVSIVFVGLVAIGLASSGCMGSAPTNSTFRHFDVSLDVVGPENLLRPEGAVVELVTIPLFSTAAFPLAAGVNLPPGAHLVDGNLSLVHDGISAPDTVRTSGRVVLADAPDEGDEVVFRAWVYNADPDYNKWASGLAVASAYVGLRYDGSQWQEFDPEPFSVPAKLTLTPMEDNITQVLLRVEPEESFDGALVDHSGLRHDGLPGGGLEIPFEAGVSFERMLHAETPEEPGLHTMNVVLEPSIEIADYHLRDRIDYVRDDSGFRITKEWY